MPVGVLEVAFQDVTPSFHYSGYQFYETDYIKLLSFFYILYFSFTPNLFN